MTEQEDVNGNDPTMVAPAAGSIFPADCIESLRQQNSRTVAPLLMRQATGLSMIAMAALVWIGPRLVLVVGGAIVLLAPVAILPLGITAGEYASPFKRSQSQTEMHR